MGTFGECNLQQFLNKHIDGDKKSLIRTFFGCLAPGLAALHDAPIGHKDIKPQNIVVKGSAVFYTDFGIVLDWSGDTRSTTGDIPAGYTPKYAAPEVLSFEPKSNASDMFSLGAIYLEMATRLF
jgi:serine/threonine protein kinase